MLDEPDIELIGLANLLCWLTGALLAVTPKVAGPLRLLLLGFLAAGAVAAAGLELSQTRAASRTFDSAPSGAGVRHALWSAKSLGCPE